jgi:hypothetical protein
MSDEWQGEQPDAGEVQPLLLDLVDRRPRPSRI